MRKGAGETGKKKAGGDATHFSSYLEAYRMYPYGGDRSGYQGGSVYDGTRQYQCDDGCLQSRYGLGKDRPGNFQTG